MTDYCRAFNDCSHDVKKWLTKQPEVKEESITDWFLYNISEKIKDVKYKQFSRSEEGKKTGADWEWWFVFSDTESFGARVQAKKLRETKDNYPGIAYVSSGKLQIEKLLEDSQTDGLASFYAFYSDNNSGHTMCGGKLNGEGVYFGEANKLHNEFIKQSRQTLKPKDILKFTNPISCLFCCPMTMERGRGMKEGFREHLKNYYPTYADLFEFEKSDNRAELGFVRTPNYVLQLLTGDINDSWEREYDRTLSKSNAIIAIDLRADRKNNSH
jgi:hypothetical protein